MPALFRIRVLVDDEVVADGVATSILCRHHIVTHPDEPTGHILVVRAELLDKPAGTVGDQDPIPIEEFD